MGDQHGLQDRLNKQHGPERPLECRVCGSHSEPLLGWSLWLTLNTRRQAENVVLIWKLFRNVAKASQKQSADETLAVPIMGMLAHAPLFFLGEGSLGISNSQRPLEKWSPWNSVQRLNWHLEIGLNHPVISRTYLVISLDQQIPLTATLFFQVTIVIIGIFQSNTVYEYSSLIFF